MLNVSTNLFHPFYNNTCFPMFSIYKFPYRFIAVEFRQKLRSNVTEARYRKCGLWQKRHAVFHFSFSAQTSKIFQAESLKTPDIGFEENEKLVRQKTRNKGKRNKKWFSDLLRSIGNPSVIF